jgi:hypothetical protein
MAELSKTEEKAFDFAQDLVKQIITLSSAIIALSITFLTDFVSGDAPSGSRTLMAVSWIFFILAVLFGIATLMAITGSLAAERKSITDSNVRNPALVHVGSFLVGLILIVIAGWLAI